MRTAKKSNKQLSISFILFSITMLILIFFTYKGNTIVQNDTPFVYVNTDTTNNKQNGINPSESNHDLTLIDNIQLAHYFALREQRESTTNSNQFANEIYSDNFVYIDYHKYRKDSIFFKPDIENSSASKTYSYNSLLLSAEQAFVRNDYERALQYYLAISAHYSSDMNIAFYAGICQYNLAEYKTAIQSLKKSYSVGYQNFKAEAQWIIANAYLKDHKPLKAEFWLKNIINEESVFKEEAQAILITLNTDSL